MAQPQFIHLDRPSRDDRSAAALGEDLVGWRAKASVITLTDVENDKRAAKLGADGWGYYNSPNDDGSDVCGIAWNADLWGRYWSGRKRLTNRTYQLYSGKTGKKLYACSTVLKYKTTGHTVLVSAVRFPDHVEGDTGFRTDDERWKARKAAYIGAVQGWRDYVKDLRKRRPTDGVLMVADWNLDWKLGWVQEQMHAWWSPVGMKEGWIHLPTKGTFGDRISDGALYRGMTTSGSEVGSNVSSSDHRPFQTAFTFLGAHDPEDDGGTEGGGTYGEAWWGFGDYEDDEIYHIDTVFS